MKYPFIRFMNYVTAFALLVWYKLMPVKLVNKYLYTEYRKLKVLNQIINDKYTTIHYELKEPVLMVLEKHKVNHIVINIGFYLTPKVTNIKLYTTRPGILIGRQGRKIDEITYDIKKEFSPMREINITIEEVLFY